MIKLIASDMDGTLLDERSQVPPETYDLIRALREKGRNVRFIYSWDDYDVFRKVPRNMPDPELTT